MKTGLLWQIALTFASLSLVAVGGATAVMPDIHRQVVETLGWMNDPTFANLFAIAQAAPGPNVMMVSLIGWHVAGAAGLVVATAAMVVPAGLLAFGAGRLLHRLAGHPWVGTVKAGLVPIAIGLVLASGAVLAGAAHHGLLTLVVTLAAAIFVVFSERNPLWALAGGAAISLLAWWAGVPV